MELKTLDTKQLSFLGATVVLLGVFAVVGSARIEAWAEPMDFVTACAEVPGTTWKAEDSLEVRVAAHDSMIACTERMEVVYIEKAETASRASLGLYALLTAAVATLIVFARRWRDGRRGGDSGGTGEGAGGGT